VRVTLKLIFVAVNMELTHGDAVRLRNLNIKGSL
jgi:hypothetical protein